MNKVFCADIETSGLDPKQGAAILEFALGGLMESTDIQSWYVEYTGTIPATAKAVHHITEDKVRSGAPNCIPRSEIGSILRSLSDSIFCFHNKIFDLAFLPELADTPAVCSYRCALHLWPELSSFSLQALRYELNLDIPPEKLANIFPHQAKYDTICCRALLEHMLKTHSLNELLELSNTPAILHKCRFGRYRGELWSEVPKDYLRWLLRENAYNSFDSDVVATAEYWLNNGKAAPPQAMARRR